MSPLTSLRRSPRKRSRTPSIISDTPTTTTSFAAEISKFANNSTPAKRTRTTTSPGIRRECSVDASAFVVTNTATTKAKSLQSTKKKAILHALDTPHPAPPRWRDTYEAIAEMRRQVLAPVDGMGCANAGDNEQDPKSKRLSVLISLMLSSQTKDEVTHQAVSKIRAAAGGEITLGDMLAMSKETLQGAINKVGFWPKKTTYIMEAMKRLRDDFDGDVPKTVEQLTSLKGVGPKMAFLALQSAWNLNSGIGVDVHVHRITNLLAWHKPHTKTPEQTRLNLQSWLPTQLWNDINPMLVGFGQTICLPVGRRCSDCTLSTKGLCPSADVRSKGGKPRSPLKQGAVPFVGVKSETEADAEAAIGGSSKMGLKVDREGGGPRLEIELEE